MSDRVYLLKKFCENSHYVDFEETLLKKETSGLKYISLILFEESGPNALDTDYIKLPNETYSNLIELLNYFDLQSYENEFLSLIPIVQNSYLTYSGKPPSGLENDFLKEKKGLEKLLDALEIYLFKDKNKLHSISFKFNTEKPITIKNFFVIDDIYKSIIESFDINEDNFISRKEDLLSNKVNSFNFLKGRQYVVMKTVQAIFSFLKDNATNITSNEALRFSGVFLHICQIPSNKKSNDILVGVIEDTLKTIDHQNLMHLKNGRLKYSV